MSPSALGLFTAATGFVLDPHATRSADVLLTARGVPVCGADQSTIRTLETALVTASAGGEQLTATSFDRVVGAFDRMGVTIDARDVSLALAALAAQSDPATGSGSTTANDVPA